MIRVRCPRCVSEFAVEDAMRGRSDRCPRCATPVPVPPDSADATAAVLTRRQTIVDVPPSDADGAAAEIEQYLDALAAAVEQANLFPPAGPGALLYVPVKVTTGGKVDLGAYTNTASLMPDTAALVRLFQAMLAVPVPAVNGRDPRRPVVQATLVFAVRGGPAQPAT